MRFSEISNVSLKRKNYIRTKFNAGFTRHSERVEETKHEKNERENVVLSGMCKLHTASYRFENDTTF